MDSETRTMLTAPDPITVTPVAPPRYFTALRFSTFVSLNYSALVKRFTELSPEERGDDFLDFCRSNFDLYGRQS